MMEIVELLIEIIFSSGAIFVHPGAFIRWLWGGGRKSYSDILQEDDAYNILITVTIYLAIAIVFLLRYIKLN